MDNISEPGETAAFVGLGANLGDRESFCSRAVRMVHETDGCRVVCVSRLYRTEPVGVNGHDWYLNAVMEVQTTLPPQMLLERLFAVEAFVGRVRSGAVEPRVIDLDLLMFGETVIKAPGLELPHPRMHLRRFVMVPMAEIAPGLVHPVLGATLEELIESCPEKGQGISPFSSEGVGWGTGVWSG